MGVFTISSGCPVNLLELKRNDCGGYVSDMNLKRAVLLLARWTVVAPPGR